MGVFPGAAYYRPFKLERNLALHFNLTYSIAFAARILQDFHFNSVHCLQSSASDETLHIDNSFDLRKSYLLCHG